MFGQTISHYQPLADKILEKHGVVYKSEDANRRRNVDFKFLPFVLTTDILAKKRFRAAFPFDRPNTCGIYGIIEDGGSMFFVMSFYDRTVEHLIKNRQVLKKPSRM